MEKFTELRGVAAVLPLPNVDTDQLIPKQFLTTIERTGLGKGLLYEMRYDPQGAEIPDFVLNQAPYRQAKILIGGENFGCGSSREHAVWALRDFGIRCVIAPSFAAIFLNNSFKNGLLLVQLPQSRIDDIVARLHKSNSAELTVDLDRQEIVVADGTRIRFEIDATRKTRLLKGLDDIEMTLQETPAIQDYARRSRQAFPWLWRGPRIAAG